MLITVGRLMVAQNVSEEEESFEGILDDHTANLVAAWDMGHRLLASYEGPAIGLRRSSDDAEMDFNYDSNGELDTAAITTWLGGASGFIHTVYDQVGSNDLVQATDASQPSYSPTSFNSGPGATFAAAEYMLANGVATTATGDDTPFTVISTTENGFTQNSGAMWGFGESGSLQDRHLAFQDFGPVLRNQRSSDGSFSTPGNNGANDDPHVYTSVFKGTTVDLYIDDSINTTDGACNVGATNFNGFAWGATPVTSIQNLFTGNQAGLMLFDSASVTDLVDIIVAYMGVKGIS